MHISLSTRSLILDGSNPVSLDVDLGQSDGSGSKGTETALFVEAVDLLLT